MNEQHPHQNALRQLPGISTLLDAMASEVTVWGHAEVTRALRDHLALLRQNLLEGREPDLAIDRIREAARQVLARRASASLVNVFNLSGIVLHSNLGRANLAPRAVAAVAEVAEGASNLEFDLATGKRGDRESHVEALICELTGAEAATAVNNNAAAVLLALNTVAMGHKVLVSRGELVEIGGSFRVPDIMARAGCSLTEVGTTNRTHIRDYEALADEAALIMKVHASNYRIEGFTASPGESALAQVANDHGIPFMIDLGSGNLIDFKALGLPPEPTVADAIKSGADLVTFSGDKLLGGPQAGLVAGRADLIAQLKANPLKRALRIDKMTLAALAETLKLYRDPGSLPRTLPTLRLILRTEADIRGVAEALLPTFESALGASYHVAVTATRSQIGSGALPVETLPSYAITLRARSGDDSDLRSLGDRLRSLPRPVVGRIQQGALWLDLRCLEPEATEQFTLQLRELNG